MLQASSMKDYARIQVKREQTAHARPMGRPTAQAAHRSDQGRRQQQEMLLTLTQVICAS